MNSRTDPQRDLDEGPQPAADGEESQVIRRRVTLGDDARRMLRTIEKAGTRRDLLGYAQQRIDRLLRTQRITRGEAATLCDRIAEIQT